LKISSERNIFHDGNKALTTNQSNSQEIRERLQCIQRFPVKDTIKQQMLQFSSDPNQKNFQSMKLSIQSYTQFCFDELKAASYKRAIDAYGYVCCYAHTIAMFGSPQQQDSICFVEMLGKFFENIRSTPAAPSPEIAASLHIHIDSWMLSCLPTCFATPSLSCLITWSLLQQNNQIKKLRDKALDLLPLKGKDIYLLDLLDEITRKHHGFDRQKHDEKQRQYYTDATLLTVENVLELISHDPELQKELSFVAHCQSILKKLENEDDPLKDASDKNITEMLACMEQFGDSYRSRSSPNESCHWRELAMHAMQFYCGILFTLENPRYLFDKNDNSETHQRVQGKISILKDQLLKGMGIDLRASNNKKRKNDKLKKLKAYRSEVRQRFIELTKNPPINDEALLRRAHDLQKFNVELVTFVKQFLEGLIASSIAALGPAPCGYSFIGFGSLEKISATPYSDIEFGVLISEDNQYNREYFRNLSYVFQSNVIELRETPIPFSLLNYSFDHLTGAGFCFDLGGKISLGRRYDERDNEYKYAYGSIKYELIGTPEQTIQYVEDDYFLVDKLLPLEVGQCTHISGNKKITSRYQALLKERFQKKNEKNITFFQQRSMTLLNGYHRDGKCYFTGDINTYNMETLSAKRGMLFDVKKEIYRIPDRLIDALGLFFGCTEESSHAKIYALLQQKRLNQYNAEQLLIIDGIAKEIRLRIYFHYDRQQESMSITPTVFSDEHTNFKSENYEIIKRFYYTSIPFHEEMKQFCDRWKKKPIPGAWLNKNRPWNSQSDETLMRIYQRLDQQEKMQDCLKRQLVNMANQLTVSPYLLFKLGGSYLDADDPKKALGYLKQALTMQERQEEQYTTDIAATLQNIGLAYYKLNDYESSKSNYERALAILKRYISNDSPELILTLSALGDVYKAQSNTEGAKALYDQALCVAQRHHHHNSVMIASQLSSLGIIDYSQRNYQQAKIRFNRSLAILKHHYGDDSINVAQAFQNLGNMHCEFGEPQHGKILLERALAIKKQHHGDYHIVVADVQLNLATAYLALGDYQYSKMLSKLALKTVKEFYGDNHIVVARIYSNLGAACFKLGDISKAKTLFERTLVIKKSHYDANHLELVNTYHNLANVLLQLEDYQGAKAVYNQALDILNTHYNDDHIDKARVLVGLGDVYCELEDHQQAKTHYTLALPILKVHYGKEHAEVKKLHKKLGLADENGNDSLQNKELEPLSNLLLTLFKRQLNAPNPQDYNIVDEIGQDNLEAMIGQAMPGSNFKRGQ
jgi:tetratricopeptide (TPR) repeat protein